jgi:predicted nucleic acid-binding protein
MDLVCDATALIYLAKADRIDVAASITGPLLVPPAVWDEAVRVGSLHGHDEVAEIYRARAKGTVVQLGEDEEVEADATAFALTLGLGRGESEALAAARDRGGQAIIDERRATNAAQWLDIPVVRTALLAEHGMGLGTLDYEAARDLLEAVVAVAPLSHRDLLDTIRKMEAMRDGD